MEYVPIRPADAACEAAAERSAVWSTLLGDDKGRQDERAAGYDREATCTRRDRNAAARRGGEGGRPRVGAIYGLVNGSIHARRSTIDKHPWLRPQCPLYLMLESSWSAATWRIITRALRELVAMQGMIRYPGWFK